MIYFEYYTDVRVGINENGRYAIVIIYNNIPSTYILEMLDNIITSHGVITWVSNDWARFTFSIEHTLSSKRPNHRPKKLIRLSTISRATLQHNLFNMKRNVTIKTLSVFERCFRSYYIFWCTIRDEQVTRLVMTGCTFRVTRIQCRWVLCHAVAGYKSIATVPSNNSEFVLNKKIFDAVCTSSEVGVYYRFKEAIV